MVRQGARPDERGTQSLVVRPPVARFRSPVSSGVVKHTDKIRKAGRPETGTQFGS